MAEGSVEEQLLVVPRLLDPIHEELLNAVVPAGGPQFDAHLVQRHEIIQPNPKRQRTGNECDLCGTSYTERRTLLRHLRTPAHCKKAGLPLRDHPCTQCRRHFTRSDLLQRHLKEVHDGVRRTAGLVVSSSTARPGRPSLLVKSIAHRSNAESAENVDKILPRDAGLQMEEDVSKSPEPISAQGLGSANFGLVAVNGTWDGHGMDSTPHGGSASQSHPEQPPGADDDQQPNFLNVTDFPSSQNPPNVPIVAPRNDTALSRESQLSDIADAVSVMSISTSASTKSAVSFRLPFRSRILQYLKGRSNPRPFTPSVVMPCPLCNKELGRTGPEVKAHVDRHFNEITDTTGTRSCQTCRVTFVHDKDLRWHNTCASDLGSCGFEFPHTEPCSGHHPPSDVSMSSPHGPCSTFSPSGVDHAAFTRQLRNWEMAQLREYREYLEDHSNGRLATTAPSYGDELPPEFRRSTGSIQSAYTCLSSSSSPGERRVRKSHAYRLNLQDTLKQRVQCQTAALDMAVSCSDLITTRRLLAEGADFADGGLKQKVMFAFNNADIELLRILLSIKTAERAVTSRMNDPGAWNLSEFLPPGGRLRHETEKHCASCIAVLMEHRVVQDFDAVSQFLAIGSPLLLRCLDLERTYDEGQTALLHYSNSNKQADVKALLAAGARVDAADLIGMTPLMHACRNRNLDLVQVYLDYGAEIDMKDMAGLTALNFASAQGDMESVCLLLDAGADPNAIHSEGSLALMFACGYGRKMSFRFLLDAGADSIATDSEGRTLLMVACRNRQVDSVHLLLHAGADPNAIDNEGRTPLMLACQYGHADSVNHLLHAGADSNATDDKGQTSLMFACRYGRTHSVNLLLRNGADPNAICRAGRTPLMLACWQGHVNAVRVLLRAGADLNAVDNQGQTSLMFARRYDHANAVRILLHAGADSNAVDNEGQTSFIFARRYGHMDSANLVLHAGAD